MSGLRSSSTSRRILLACFDAVSLAIAWFATLNLRLLFNTWLPVQFTREVLLTVAPPLPMILLLWAVVAVWQGAYSKKVDSTVVRSVGAAMEAAFVMASLIVVETVLIRNLGLAQSRSFVFVFMPLSGLCLGVGRYIAWVGAAALHKKYGVAERCALVGGIQDSMSAFGTITSGLNGSGLQFAGVILPQDENGFENGVHSLRILGSTKNLAELINCERLDRIIIVPDRIPQPELAECARTSRRMGITMSHVIGPAVPDARAEFSVLPGLRLIDLKPVFFTRKQEIAKRIFDVAVAAVSLLLLAPLLIFFAVLVKLTSAGPVMYRSWRVGRGGRHFLFYKFRSMYDAAEARRAELAARNEHTGHLFKVKDDPRVTPLGRFMRRYSIDELPQLINVLIGDMSLVGPRPLPASDLHPDGQSPFFANWAEQRSRVLPGITGLWQVRGRSDLQFKEMMDLDSYYIRNWSLKLDIKILLQTPLVVLIGRGAY